MKTVFLLRHAKSSRDHPELDDHDRPLNKRGKRQAPEMGKLILAENLTPDLILSSTAKRASKTAQAVAENCGYDGKVDWIDDFYPGWPADYLRVLSELPDGVQRVMVVGHNPGLEEFLRLLVGEAGTEHLSSVNYSGTARILSGTLPTATLAQVDLPLESWQDLTASTRGKLVRILRASEKDK
jgi:phosphohistidine phosphatase